MTTNIFVPFKEGTRIRAYLGAAPQSIPNITWTKILFDVEQWDTLSEWDNSRFTVKKKGYYSIMAQGVYAAASTVQGKQYALGIRKNAASYRSQNNYYHALATGSGCIWWATQTIEFLIVGDYIEVDTYQNTGGAIDLYNGDIQTGTYVAIARLR